MRNRRITRRTAMREGAALAGAGAVAGTAGCLGPVRRVISGGSTDVTYANWLYAPGTVEPDRRHHAFLLLDHPGLVEHRSEFDPDLYSSMVESREGEFGITGLGFEDIETEVGFSEVVVLTGSFDAGSVVDELERNGFTDLDTHEGFELYVSGDGTRAAGVAADAIVLSPSFAQVPAIEAVVATIDAHAGSEDRYVETNADMATLVDVLGRGDIVSGQTMDEPADPAPRHGRFDGRVAVGVAYDVRGTTTDARIVVVFAAEGDVDTTVLKVFVRSNDDDDEFFADWDRVEFDRHGRSGVISGRFDTADLVLPD